MESKKKLHIMLDIETLGTKPGSIILSVAYKAFSLNGEGAELGRPSGAEPSGKSEGTVAESRHISLLSSLMYHMTSDFDTEEWWKAQSEEAKLSAALGQKASEPMENVMLDLYYIFNELNQNFDVYYWGRGVGSFDIPILEEAMRRVHEDKRDGEFRSPFKFYKTMDVRSIVNFCKFTGLEIEKKDTPHVASADVDKQIEEIQNVYNAIF